MAGGFGDPFAFPYVHNWYNILANYVPAETVAAAISGEHPWTDPEIVASSISSLAIMVARFRLLSR